MAGLVWGFADGKEGEGHGLLQDSMVIAGDIRLLLVVVVVKGDSGVEIRQLYFATFELVMPNRAP